jgi:hypothetical protein
LPGQQKGKPQSFRVTYFYGDGIVNALEAVR